jgi:hypothetical protein
MDNSGLGKDVSIEKLDIRRRAVCFKGDPMKVK